MKEYLYKIYDKTGVTFQGLLEPDKVLNKISFASAIGGGQGELRIKYNVPFEEIPSFLNEDSVIRVYEVSDDNPKGRLIYGGFIPRIMPIISNQDNRVDLACLGLASILPASLYRTGGSNHTVTYTNEDIADIFKDVIDNFNTRQGTLLSYTGASIPATGNLITKTYTRQNHLQILQDAFKAAGGDKFWRVDASGLVTLQTIPTSASIKFVFTRDVIEGNATLSVENMKNGLVLVAGGGLGERVYSDATSQSTYRIREAVIEDNDITDTTSADNFGDSFIAQNKDLENLPKLNIGKGYNIFNISPGQTCKVLNIDKTSEIFGDNMLINRVDYKDEIATLHLTRQDAIFSVALVEAIKNNS